MVIFVFLKLYIAILLTDRLKVLRHHPDKRRARGEEVHPDDDYFTCITRAYDILGNPRNRRSYDSVDPQFDNTLPVVNEHSRNNFFEVRNRRVLFGIFNK